MSNASDPHSYHVVHDRGISIQINCMGTKDEEAIRQVIREHFAKPLGDGRFKTRFNG